MTEEYLALLAVVTAYEGERSAFAAHVQAQAFMGVAVDESSESAVRDAVAAFLNDPVRDERKRLVAQTVNRAS